ncbi:MAG: PAS domain-containing protein [Planctomycetes bacterium]|nr:PAS domain-containing protein [Planctomycetota bacterium]
MEAGPIHVLLIEDNVAYAKMLQAGLSSGDVLHTAVEIRHAENIRTAFDLLAGHKFDLILLDLMLPDSSGLETLVKIQAVAVGVPVVVLTGVEDVELAETIIQKGAQDYLVKGHSDWEVLPRAIRYAVNAKRAEKEIQRLASFPQLAPTLVFEIDAAGNVAFCNASAHRMLARLGLGDDPKVFLPADFGKVLERLGHGKMENFRTEVTVKDRVFGMGVYLVPQFSTVRIYAIDITDRKKAELELAREKQLLRVLIDHLPDQIFVKDAQSRFLIANKAVGENLGVEPGEMTGKSDADYFPAEYAGQYLKDEQEVIQSGRPIEDRETPGISSEAVKRWFLSTKVPLRDENGGIIGLVGINKEITGLKIADEALRRQARELARSNADLQQFAYSVSHDLQEPLRTIASFITLLARKYRGNLDKQADEFIGFVVDGASRMQRLINDLLDYSRVDTHGKAPRPTDAKAVLDRVLASLGAALAESSASVVCDGLPTVMVDASQLGQLLQNLVSNAIKFRADEPPKIHISARPDGGKWVFSVADNGIGIPAEHKEKIFEIFQRLHSRARYPGTGVGLAICKKIVQRHGGEIWVESAAGGGSTFCFTLPAAGAEPAGKSG